MDITPSKRVGPVECFPFTKGFENYTVWCEMTWGPEPTPVDIQNWWCTPCRMVFDKQDEARPQRCPVCDAEATPTPFGYL